MKTIYRRALGGFGVLIGWLTSIPATATLHAADKGAASPTAAELRARVAALEQELARVQRNYQSLLTTTCLSQPASVAPSADDSFERASAASEQQAFEEANPRGARQRQRRREEASWYVKDPGLWYH